MNSGEHRKRLEQAEKALKSLVPLAKQDACRLRYHFMPEAGWMNDPNGLIYYQGHYHLFFQHHPYSDKNGPMHWGHARSKDLVHWEHLPIALAPSEPYDLGSVGGYGCWSGSAVEKDGCMHLFYTGHVDGRDPTEVQCMAVSADGVVFEKDASNPVVPGSPQPECFGFRDPKVWNHGEKWYMVVGSGHRGRGQALLYKSDDLTNWQYVGIAAQSDGTQGDMWECPDLFPLGDKHVLIISPMNVPGVRNLYLVGEMDYERGTFIPENSAKLDDGLDFYAAQTFSDGKGRRILIGWMDHWGSTLLTDRGWNGAMTLPRELKLLDDGTVISQPVEELECLRVEETDASELSLMDGDTRSWIRPEAMEWMAEWEISSAGANRLEVCLDGIADKDKEITISCEWSESMLIVRARVGEEEKDRSEARLPLMGKQRVKLRLYVDNGSFELFINDGRRVITHRYLPCATERRLSLTAVGGPMTFTSLRWWALADIWKKDEKTCAV